MSDRPPIFGQPPFGGAFTGAFSTPFSGKGGFDAKAQGNLSLDLNSFSLNLNNNDPVSTWSDDSGFGNDATETGIDRPTFKSSGINGFAALDFNGTNQEMVIISSASLQLAASFTAYVVCIKDTNAFTTMFSKNGNTDYRWLFSSGGESRSIVSGQDDIATTPTPVATPAIMELHYAVGGNIKMTQNGTSIGTPTNPLSFINTSGTEMLIGSTTGAPHIQFFNGMMARILIYSNLLSTANRNNVIRGLGNQFGITVGTVS